MTMYKNKINNSYIEYSEDCGELVIDKLFVSPEDRGVSLGYKLLDLAKEKAKELSIDLSLYAEPDEDMPTEKLVEYYMDYGFESDGDCDQLMTLTIY